MSGGAWMVAESVTGASCIHGPSHTREEGRKLQALASVPGDQP
jgi:hypothetical protein